MTPNVSRFLIKWGVADIIGNNLGSCNNICMRTRTGEMIQSTELNPSTQREFGFPWWVVHRAHLHEGLSESARHHGATIHIDSRVTHIDHSSQPVKVTTAKGTTHEFDLLIGSDGLKSIVRTTLFPAAQPIPLTANAAYRAIIPYSKLFAEIPEAKAVFRDSLEVWCSHRSYIIAYPICGGRDLNLVLEHHQPQPVYDVEDVHMPDFLAHYTDYDPLLQRVLGLIPTIKRWPLLQTGPLESWSNTQKNVVLMGDAAHSMVNHMACVPPAPSRRVVLTQNRQGAATSIEDGVFLARCLHEVVHGVLTLPEAVTLYERGRMPRAWLKQQVSFMTGAAYMYEDEPRGRLRAEASVASAPSADRQSPAASEGGYNGGPSRSSVIDKTKGGTGLDTSKQNWNYIAPTEMVPSIWGYDAEGDADWHVLKYLMEERGTVDPHTRIASKLEEKWTGWYLPKEWVGSIAKSRL